MNSNWMRTRRPMFVEHGCIYRTARCEAGSTELGSVRGQHGEFTPGLKMGKGAAFLPWKWES